MAPTKKKEKENKEEKGNKEKQKKKEKKKLQKGLVPTPTILRPFLSSCSLEENSKLQTKKNTSTPLHPHLHYLDYVLCFFCVCVCVCVFFFFRFFLFAVFNFWFLVLGF